MARLGKLFATNLLFICKQVDTKDRESHQLRFQFYCKKIGCYKYRFKMKPNLPKEPDQPTWGLEINPQSHNAYF